MRSSARPRIAPPPEPQRGEPVARALLRGRNPALFGASIAMLKPRNSSLLIAAACARLAFAEVPPEHVHDLSLLVSPEWPCVWPSGMMQHIVVPTRTFGPGAYHRELIIIDEHTGTQWDAPAHFVSPPDSGLPGAGPMGLITGEKVPVWQFVGEACVIDVTAHCDDAKPGHSFLITPEQVQAWEEKHRPLGAGDVVLFRSDYSDKYYQPIASGGVRFVHQVLRKQTPGWPAPTPETMKYLGGKGVMSAGLDGASMGPVPDLAVATHQAGGALGMIWIECGTNLGKLPPTGAFYALLPAKHAGGSGGEARVIAITEPALAKRLNESARAKRVTDLSVVLDENYPVTWPGLEPADDAQRYVSKTLNAFSRTRGPFFALTHTMDSQAGTHLVTPAFSLPPKGFNPAQFTPEIRKLRAQFEKRFGALSYNDMTIEKVPLAPLLGEARIIDVKQLAGTIAQEKWPASPRITVELMKSYEEQTGPIQKGEIVIFRSGWSDMHYKPLPDAPEVDRFMAASLAGKEEGWAAAAPEALIYLAGKGVRCVGTDAPTLGGVEREAALLTYWAAAKHGMFAVECLTNLAALPEKGAFFLFAPIKIEGARSGYGRALALH